VGGWGTDDGGAEVRDRVAVDNRTPHALWAVVRTSSRPRLEASSSQTSVVVLGHAAAAAGWDTEVGAPIEATASAAASAAAVDATGASTNVGLWVHLAGPGDAPHRWRASRAVRLRAAAPVLCQIVRADTGESVLLQCEVEGVASTATEGAWTVRVTLARAPFQLWSQLPFPVRYAAASASAPGGAVPNSSVPAVLVGRLLSSTDAPPLLYDPAAFVSDGGDDAARPDMVRLAMDGDSGTATDWVALDLSEVGERTVVLPASPTPYSVRASMSMCLCLCVCA
jgi:hypothetical protein